MTFYATSSPRRFGSARRFVSCLTAVVMVAACPGARASKPVRHKHPRLHAVRQMLMLDVGLPGIGFLPDGDEDEAMPELPIEGKKYELKLARQGGEMVDVVYRIGNTYMPEALDKLSSFLHDTHNDEVKSYDPRTFDVLHTMLAKLDRSSSVIQILSAYRSQETNDALRASGTTNAAEHSQHIEGKALDFRVLGVSATALRQAALSLAAGGVGYYPSSQFVHVDTGPVREWVFAGHHGSRHRRRRGA